MKVLHQCLISNSKSKVSGLTQKEPLNTTDSSRSDGIVMSNAEEVELGGIEHGSNMLLPWFAQFRVPVERVETSWSQ